RTRFSSGVRDRIRLSQGIDDRVHLVGIDGGADQPGDDVDAIVRPRWFPRSRRAWIRRARAAMRSCWALSTSMVVRWPAEASLRTPSSAEVDAARPPLAGRSPERWPARRMSTRAGAQRVQRLQSAFF